MKYCIIGLGIYGSNLAKDLTAMGHEVVGADNRPANVEAIKNLISTAYIIDATDEASLAVLPLKNCDVVIVAIGENFGASVKTVALLKQMGVPHIYARAIDPLHEAILKGFELDRIITPEQRAAWDLVYEMELGSRVESLAVTDQCYVLRFSAPTHFEGMKYSELNLSRDFNIKLIAAATFRSRRNLLGLQRNDYVLIPDSQYNETSVVGSDRWTCLGMREDFRSLFRYLS